MKGEASLYSLPFFPSLPACILGRALAHVFWETYVSDTVLGPTGSGGRGDSSKVQVSYGGGKRQFWLHTRSLGSVLGSRPDLHLRITCMILGQLLNLFLVWFPPV